MSNNAPDYENDLNKQEQEIKQLRALLKDVRKLWKGKVFMPDNQEQIVSVASWRANNRDCDEEVCLSDCFDIAPVDDWTQSLRRVEKQ